MGARKFPATSWSRCSTSNRGFQSPEYVTRDRIVNIDAPQPEYVQLSGRAGREVVAEWRAKRQMAERAGLSFEVKAKAEAGERQSGDGAFGAKGGSVAGWACEGLQFTQE